MQASQSNLWHNLTVLVIVTRRINSPSQQGSAQKQRDNACSLNLRKNKETTECRQTKCRRSASLSYPIPSTSTVSLLSASILQYQQSHRVSTTSQSQSMTPIRVSLYHCPDLPVSPSPTHLFSPLLTSHPSHQPVHTPATLHHHTPYILRKLHILTILVSHSKSYPFFPFSFNTPRG